MEKWDEWGDKPRVVRASFRTWDRDSAEKPRSHRIRDRAAAIAAAPSFSSSLLDSIYRSIDDDETGKTRSTLRRAFTETPGNSLPPLHRPPGKLGSLRIPRQYPPPPPAGAAPRRRSSDRRAYGASTSGSSESSYGGFSEPDTARHGGEKKAGSIRSRLRQSRIYRELKKAGAPASPGSRLAAFLNSLFPPKARPPPPPKAASAAAAVTCSSAPPIARSCLGLGVGGRSVRFDAAPAASERSAAEEREDRRRREAAMAVLGLGLGKGGAGEEEDDDDAASCASSDLFELEDLDGCGCAGVGRYRDELPVYGTTRVESNMAIARGLLV